MPTICYIDKRFSVAREWMIDRANEIIAEYRAQGFNLTLRQLYYQFVARDLIDNTVANYKRLGNLVSDARLAGRIDWAAIEDRTRQLQSVPHWNNPAHILADDAKQFRIDKWARQSIRPEVWVEKEALAGVFESICEPLDVAFFCCRGYGSQSALWEAAQRHIANRNKHGQRTIILHCGDHDPSGIDMTRDNDDRLSLFGRSPAHVARLALNMDQVEEYDPPPNPAKVTDSRFATYAARFGVESWELDALEPRVLADLVNDAVDQIRDDDLWEQAVAEESEYGEQLARAAGQWDRIADTLETEPDENDE